MSDVTVLLDAVNSGKKPHATEELLAAVYNELRVMAQAEMRREKPGHTLQPTVLVNDAWLKLFSGGKTPKFNGRAHFFGAAANAMRRILVDHARRKRALKRGKREELSETEFAQFAHPSTDELILAVDEALGKFAKVDTATARLIELRFFVGMTMRDAAEALGIPLRSAERDYKYFSAWFRREFELDLKGSSTIREK